MQATATEKKRFDGRELDDATLLSHLSMLVTRDRTTTAKLLWHLAEVDVRGLYRDEGYSSLFDYCVKALHMSEGEASLRIRAARLSRNFPVVLAKVERGELHLSALRALAPVLTEDNHQELLAAATHRTRRDVEQMLADRAPKPDVKGAMRRLPSAKPSSNRSQGAGSPLGKRPAEPQSLELTVLGGQPPAAVASPAVPCTPPSPSAACTRTERRGETTPLGEQRYRVQFTANQQLHDQIHQAQELLRHQVPDGDLATIMGKAITLLVDQLKKQRFGHRTRPRGSARSRAQGKKAASKKSAREKSSEVPKGSDKAIAPPSSPRPGPAAVSNAQNRHIPASVRRAVDERDGGRCTFVSAGGHRCEATGMLEFHHEDPYAKGGAATVENIRLLCRSHNALLAERDFGRDFILRMRQGTRAGARHARQQTIPGPSQG